MVRHTDRYDHATELLERFAAMPPSHPARRVVRDELVAAFLPVARNIAHRYARRGEPADDLLQVASIGLLKALDRYDPAKGRDFLSYAVPTMMGEVRRYFRDCAWSVRAPRDLKDRYVAVGSAITRLARATGHSPTTTELAEHLNLSHDQVLEALAARYAYRSESLDKTPTTDNGHPPAGLLDILVAHDPAFARAENSAVLHDVVRALPEREQRLLALRFVHDMTQREIGSELCISQMHVSRLLAQTLDLLRSKLKDPPLTAPPAPSGPYRLCGPRTPTATEQGHGRPDRPTLAGHPQPVP